eukprot:SAG31_NODE_46336_length_255_cov_0.621795_1_plen_50_part_01
MIDEADDVSRQSHYNLQQAQRKDTSPETGPTAAPRLVVKQLWQRMRIGRD